MSIASRARALLVLALLSPGLLVLTARSVSAAGTPAPDFRAPRLDAGGEFALADHRGELVLLEFWASWCGPCWRALDALTAVQARWAERGLHVVTVSVDEDPEKARAFAARRAPALAVLADPAGEVADRYAVQGMPATFLIDGEGRIVARFEGFHRDREQEIERAVAARMRAAPGPAVR